MNLKLKQQDAKELPDDRSCDFSVLCKGWEKTAGELGPGHFLGGFRPVLHPDRRREHCVQQARQQRGGRPPSVQQQRGHPVAPAGRDVLLRLQQTQVSTPDGLPVVSRNGQNSIVVEVFPKYYSLLQK